MVTPEVAARLDPVMLCRVAVWMLWLVWMVRVRFCSSSLLTTIRFRPPLAVLTAYAVRTASGGLNLIVVNKDELQNLTLTIQTSQSIQTATLQSMTGSSLAATSGVTIQG